MFSLTVQTHYTSAEVSWSVSVCKPIQYVYVLIVSDHRNKRMTSIILYFAKR